MVDFYNSLEKMSLEIFKWVNSYELMASTVDFDEEIRSGNNSDFFQKDRFIEAASIVD